MLETTDIMEGYNEAIDEMVLRQESMFAQGYMDIAAKASRVRDYLQKQYAIEWQRPRYDDFEANSTARVADCAKAGIDRTATLNNYREYLLAADDIMPDDKMRYWGYAVDDCGGWVPAEYHVGMWIPEEEPTLPEGKTFDQICDETITEIQNAELRTACEHITKRMKRLSLDLFVNARKTAKTQKARNETAAKIEGVADCIDIIEAYLQEKTGK